MEICKLCLTADKPEYEDNEEPIQNEMQTVQNLIPQLNIFLNINSMVCFLCTNNIKTIGRFINNIKQAEQKIETALLKDKKQKLDIKSLHPKINALRTNLKDLVTACRLCLKFIATPSIFLYDNDTNILEHSLIQKMLLFCNVNLNFDISEKPTICTDCWEVLQALFSFKKNCLEIENKMSFYCNKFNLRRENINNEILRKIYTYFSNNDYIPHFEQPSISIQKNIKTENTDYNSHIVMEHDYISYFNDKGYLAIRRNKLGVKRGLTDEEDRMLFTTYLVVTKNEKVYPNRYWNKILEIWKELNPKSKHVKSFLKKRLRYLKINGMNKYSIDQIKLDVAKKLHDISPSEEITSSKNIQNKHKLKQISTFKPQEKEDKFLCFKSLTKCEPVMPLLINETADTKMELRSRKPTGNVSLPDTNSTSNIPTIIIKSFDLENNTSPVLKKKVDLPKTMTSNLNIMSPNSNKIETSTLTYRRNEVGFENVPISKNAMHSPENNLRSTPRKANRRAKNNIDNKIVIHSVKSFQTENDFKWPNILQPRKIMKIQQSASPSNPLLKNNSTLANETAHSSKINPLFESNSSASNIIPEKPDVKRNINNTHFKQNCSNSRSEDTGKRLRSDTKSPNNSTGNINNIGKFSNREPDILSLFEENSSNSDDSFIDEVAHCSLANSIKVEPLDDSDIEIWVNDPKTDLYTFQNDSDESLPELERMDIPPMNIKIDRIYSVDTKQEMLNTVLEAEDSNVNVEQVNTCRMLNTVLETEDPNVNVEQVNTCRRYLFGNQPIDNGQFKCVECNFETKYRSSASYHSKWHSKIKSNKKLHECTECPYKISNKWLLKKHMQLHKEENESSQTLSREVQKKRKPTTVQKKKIPELLPWTTT